MHKRADFRGPYLKTLRAIHHIADLETVFQEYRRENEKPLAQDDPVRPARDSFPLHTPTILGDALHNLRASLDHAYCLLIEANGHRISERSTFPITRANNADAMRGSIAEQRRKGSAPSEGIVDYIFDEIQPYAGGKGDDLLRLHQLDITDKHMILLPTAQHLHFTKVMTSDTTSISDLKLITSGSLVINFGAGPTDHGGYFEICFGEGQPFEGQPVLPTLKQLSDRVNLTLQALEAKAHNEYDTRFDGVASI